MWPETIKKTYVQKNAKNVMLNMKHKLSRITFQNDLVFEFLFQLHAKHNNH